MLTWAMAWLARRDKLENGCLIVLAMFIDLLMVGGIADAIFHR